MHTLRDGFQEGPPELTIGDHAIAANSQPYVIAEAGVNHNGSVDQARRLVDAAKQAGAQAVKFQVFSAEALVTAEAPAAAYQVTGSGCRSQRELLRGLELDRQAFEALAAHCRTAAIDFLATPFSIADLQVVVALGVPALKIASPDLNNHPLLSAAAATGLPLLLSTGASYPVEIDEAVAYLDRCEACDRLVLLHCVSCYPTPPARAALCNITRLYQRYGVWSGYSDHTESTDIAGLAVACGARVLEKHLTLDRSLPGPDQAFSLTPAMFQEYVQAAHRAWQCLGLPRDAAVGEELEVRRLARKSVVSRAAIRQGQAITVEMLTLKRPGGGIEPRDVFTLIGREAACDIAADVPLDWSMVR